MKLKYEFDYPNGQIRNPEEEEEENVKFTDDVVEN